MKRAILSIFLAASLTSPLAAAELRLSLDETAILPGTATGVSIIVDNSASRKALELPPFLWLTATNEEFETFSVRAAALVSDGTAVGIPAEQRSVPAGATREFRYDPSNVLLGSTWFGDERIAKPGQYRLRAVLAPEVAEDGTFNAAHALASKEEVLTIAPQSEDDAAVWAWMAKRGGGTWGDSAWMKYPGEFAEFVRTNHPESQYALYAAVFAPRGSGERTEVLAEQIKRYPNKAFTDQLRLLVVHYHQQKANLARQTDLRTAANAAEAARTVAAELVRNTRSIHVRARAKEFLRTIPTRAQLTQAVR
jgi:hypothetical protein